MKDNPFQDDNPKKAYYHPSRRKKLSQNKTTTVITAKGTDSKTTWNMSNKGDFLDLSNTVKRVSADDDLSFKFNESWASSEGQNSFGISMNMSDNDDMRKSLFDKSDLDDSRHVTKDGAKQVEYSESVLSKYIERFRSGEAISRDKRRALSHSGESDFWWLNNKARGDHLDDISSEATSKRLMPTALRNQQKTLEESTKILQEKADQLLAESTSSWPLSDACVSTDGLGSSPSSVGSRTSLEMYTRPAFTRAIQTGRHPPDSSIPGMNPSPYTPSKPEDDILYQWRLRRKLELARNTTTFDSAKITPPTTIPSYAHHGPGKISDKYIPKIGTSDCVQSGKESSKVQFEIDADRSDESKDSRHDFKSGISNASNFCYKKIDDPNCKDKKQMKSSSDAELNNIGKNLDCSCRKNVDKCDCSSENNRGVHRCHKVGSDYGSCLCHKNQRCDSCHCQCSLYKNGICGCYIGENDGKNVREHGLCRKDGSEWCKNCDVNVEHNIEHHKILQAEKPHENSRNIRTNNERTEYCGGDGIGLSRDNAVVDNTHRYEPVRDHTCSHRIIDKTSDKMSDTTSDKTSDISSEQRGYSDTREIGQFSKAQSEKNDRFADEQRIYYKQNIDSEQNIDHEHKIDSKQKNDSDQRIDVNDIDTFANIGEISEDNAITSSVDLNDSRKFLLNSTIDITPIKRVNSSLDHDSVERNNEEINKDNENIKRDLKSGRMSTKQILSHNHGEVKVSNDDERKTGTGRRNRRNHEKKDDISETIGQVIRGRLFDTSQLSSLSMDDISDLTSVSPLTSSINDDYESDNEFGDDKMLKILRCQRSSYETQLRTIDALLSQHVT